MQVPTQTPPPTKQQLPLQVQHLVCIPDPAPLPDPDPTLPDAPRWAALLRRMDADADGLVSRRDMLMAFRRDRQLADHLKMPPRIRVRVVL